MRGKPPSSPLALSARRITPAGAGKTARSDSLRRRKRDHPRRCGENKNTGRCRTERLGSPPQVRGKLLCGISPQASLGITPAGAGKTAVWAQAALRLWDHPRRCGENLNPVAPSYSVVGSPPQVRGKPRRHTIKCSNIRITPAGAGKTSENARKIRAGEDHPRRCGENVFLKNTLFCQLGSPPQVRGKRDAVVRRTAGYGITPAGAGKTERRICLHSRYKDHPRRCGENICGLSAKADPEGSPPQVRGKLQQRRLNEMKKRITPAGAGKTRVCLHVL